MSLCGTIPIFPHGIDLIDVKIIQNLHDRQLIAVCGSNRYLDSLCREPEFWRIRLSKRLGFDLKITKTNYQEVYKKLSPISNNFSSLAKGIAKYGYLEILQESLSLNKIEEYVNNFNIKLEDVISNLYASAIWGGVGAMSLIEAKYKLDSSNITEVLERYVNHVCDFSLAMDPGSVHHLMNYYTNKQSIPSEIYDLAITSGDVGLVDLLLSHAVRFEPDLIYMSMLSIISGSILMVNRVKLLCSPVLLSLSDIFSIVTWLPIMQNYTIDHACVLRTVIGIHYTKKNLHQIVLKLFFRNNVKLIEALTKIGISINLDSDDINEILNHGIKNSYKDLVLYILRWYDPPTHLLFDKLAVAISYGNSRMFEIFWSRINKGVFSLLMKSVSDGVNAESVAEMVRMMTH